MPAVIKSVSKESWKLLRTEAIKHGVTTGKMVELLVKEHVEHEKNRPSAWDVILKRKPVLSAKEAAGIRKAAERMRKGFSMRT